MGSSGGPGERKKKEKKPKKDRYVDKEKAVQASAPAAAAGTSSMTDVTYTIDQLKDPEFWKSKPELKDAPGSRWKYAPDDAFEDLDEEVFTSLGSPCFPHRRCSSAAAVIRGPVARALCARAGVAPLQSAPRYRCDFPASSRTAA